MLDDAIAGKSAVSRAPFVLHVVWHPRCSAAPAIADELRRHFASDRYHDIAGGAGVTVLFRDVDAPNSDAPPAIDWTDGLTAMRELMLEQTDARLVLGGKLEGYKGAMSGIAEEALLSMKAKQPVFLVGGFGGCARDIAETLGAWILGPAPGARGRAASCSAATRMVT